MSLTRRLEAKAFEQLGQPGGWLSVSRRDRTKWGVLLIVQAAIVVGVFALISQSLTGWIVAGIVLGVSIGFFLGIIINPVLAIKWWLRGWLLALPVGIAVYVVFLVVLAYRK